MVGELVCVSNSNFNNIKGCKIIENSFPEPFFIKALNGKNAFQVEFFEEISNKHPTFPVSLIKPYKSGDAEKSPLRNNAPLHISPVESSATKKITKVLKERKLGTKKLREYLYTYSDPACDDELLEERYIPEATKLLRMFRHTRNNNITK
ncbi:hypothetical protein O181_029782 [Austropuccinia psidii MF-1]|uniref:Uncharacterized protein n=1 Tax=Austropuccinia psidii MF-1 TaxID=1389203 RepID=A0A9Q3CXA2_9BASI|nr:hypothetical protein [Austropuccinia psidii MF-1]